MYIDYTTPSGREQIYQRAAEGDVRVIGLLLENGWVPDTESLIMAAKNGHDEVCNLLLAFGAPGDGAVEDGVTPLLAAVGRGHLATVQLLLASGADPTRVTRHGKNVLELARDGLLYDEEEERLLEDAIREWQEKEGKEGKRGKEGKKEKKAEAELVGDRRRKSGAEMSSDGEVKSKKRKLMKKRDKEREKEERKTGDEEREREIGDVESVVRKVSGRKDGDRKDSLDPVTARLLSQSHRQKSGIFKAKSPFGGSKRADKVESRSGNASPGDTRDEKDDKENNERAVREEQLKLEAEREKEREREREREREQEREKEREREREREREAQRVKREKEAAAEAAAEAERQKLEKQRLAEEEARRKERQIQLQKEKEKRDLYEAQKEQKRKEQEEQIKANIERMKRQQEELQLKKQQELTELKKQQEEEILRQQKERERQAEERKQQEEFEKEKARRIAFRECYPYGLLHANWGVRKPQEYTQYLPLYAAVAGDVFGSNEGSELWVSDLQVILAVGDSDFHVKYPELSRKAMNVDSKTALWRVLKGLMLPRGNISSKEYDVQREKFVSLGLNWLKLSEVLNTIDTNYPTLSAFFTEHPPIIMDVDETAFAENLRSFQAQRQQLEEKRHAQLQLSADAGNAVAGAASRSASPLVRNGSRTKLDYRQHRNRGIPFKFVGKVNLETKGP